MSLFTIKQKKTQQILLKCKNQHDRLIGGAFEGQKEIVFQCCRQVYRIDSSLAFCWVSYLNPTYNIFHIQRDSVTPFSFFISLSKEITGLDSVDAAARIQSTISVFVASYFRRALRTCALSVFTIPWKFKIPINPAVISQQGSNAFLPLRKAHKENLHLAVA